MAQLLKEFEAEMLDQDILCKFPDEVSLRIDTDGLESLEKQAFVGPCWMDDLCVCLTAENNAQLERCIGIATSTILDHFLQRGMSPNLKPGKTALLITPQGLGHCALEEEALWAPVCWEVQLHW